MGARVNDIAYLLGATDVKDAYTDELLANASADLGVTPDMLRQLYQVAVESSSAVLVSAGGDNMLYAASEISKIMNDGEAIPMDFTQFESLDPGFVAALADIKATINGILIDMFGADSAIVEDFDTASDVIETVAYSLLGYTDYYNQMIAAIKELNPDTQIIIVGAYNMLDGFVYQKDGINVDVGAISEIVVGAINQFMISSVEEYANTMFIDMTYAHENPETINLADISSIDDLYEYIPYMILSEENLNLQIEAVQQVLSSVEYTLTTVIGDEEPETVTYKFGEPIVLDDPVRTGYTFSGWAGEIPATMPACDLFFYGEFEVNSYDVVYYLNGNVYAEYTYDFGETLVDVDPTEIGYTFSGWDASVPATMPAEDLEFYGTLEPITFTVSFDANGGEGTMPAMTFTYDVTQALDANSFTMENYYFAGWNTAADGSGTAFGNEAVVGNLTAEDGATVTLYAQWTAEEGVITDLETAKAVGIVVLVLSIISTAACLFALRKH
jgi:hypothetical protein